MFIFRLVAALTLGLTVSATMTFLPGPATQANSTLVTNPNSAVADAVATVTLTFTARDAYNSVVPGLSVSLSSSGTSNVFAATSGTTDANGLFTTSLRSSVAQTKTVTATFGDSNNYSVSASVLFVPGAASAAKSSFIINPNSTVADNSSALTGILTLLDAQSNPIANIAPTYFASGTSTSVASSGATSAAGQSSVSFTTSLAQNENAVVQAGGLNFVAAMSFVAGPATQANSTFVASPNVVVANGAASMALSFAGRDAFNNPVPGMSVSLAASGGNNTFGASSGTTAGNGNFATSLSSTLAQSETLTASFAATSLSLPVQFIPGPASSVTSSLIVNPNQTTADNSNTLTALLTLRDAQNNPIAGVTPSFAASGSSTTVTAFGNTSVGGQASASYKTAVAQNENATVAAGGLNLSALMVFAAGPPTVAASTLTASPNVVAGDGAASISLVTTARDAQGNNVPSVGVALSASGGNTTFGSAGGTTLGNGSYTTTLKSTQMQTETITALIGGSVTETVSVTFTGNANATTSSLTLSPNTQIVGPSHFITAALTLRDAAANPLSGVTPVWTTSGQNNTIVSSGATSSAGVGTATYSTTLAQSENIQVSAGGVNSLYQPGVFIADSPNATASYMYAAPVHTAANNSNTIVASVMLLDAFGNGVSGQTASFAASGGNTTVSAPVATNSSGLAQATYRSATAQNENATVSVAALSFATPITFTDVASQCTLSVNPNVQTADGNSAMGLVATFTSTSSQPVPYLQVRFSSTGAAQTFSAQNLVTSATGQATANLTSFYVGSNTILAQSGNVQCASQGNFLARTAYCSGNPNYSFAAYATGSYPQDVATGDFNGDGKRDIAVINSGSSTLGIFLGTGSGTFQPQVTYATGSEPASLITGDFNGDGKPDVAVVNGSGNTLGIFLNTGSGAFAPQVTYATGSDPYSLSTGDFNGDGNQDVVVANNSSSNVSVFMGAGAGTFLPQVTYTTGSYPRGVATGDFNGDGKQDIVIANYGTSTLGILLGTGSGTFGPQSTYATGTSPYSVMTGDFNGDGKQDVVLANNGNNTLSILLGTGSGTFQAQVSYATGSSPRGVTTGDFNGDGKQDVAVTNYSSGTLGVFLGTGTGTFAPQVAYTTDTSPASVATGDFNGDGKQDMALVTTGGVSLDVFLTSCP